jgi:hypothetical protein
MATRARRTEARLRRFSPAEGFFRDGMTGLSSNRDTDTAPGA